MKHFYIFALLLTIAASTSMAQTKVQTAAEAATESPAKSPVKYYIEIVVSQKAGGRASDVSISIGRDLLAKLGPADKAAKSSVVGMTFSSAPDALNFLSLRGWQLVDSYSIPTPSGSTAHLVMMLETDQPAVLIQSLLKADPTRQ